MRIPSGVTDQYIYFVAVDATDFTSRETGLSSFTVYRSRNGGAAAAMTTPTINETDATNMPGVYELLLDEDMSIDSGDDSQEMVFHITHAGMHPVTRTIELYRSKITAGETLTVSSGNANAAVQSIAANAITATSIATDAITAAKIAANAIGASELAADAVAEIADAVWDEAQSGHVGAGTFGEIATEIASILVDTAEIGAAGAGLSAVPWNAAWDAEVQSEVDDALVARSLHYLVNTALPTNWATDVTANSALDYLADDGTASYDRTTDSLQAIADSGGGGPTAAQIADAVWDEAQSGHVGAGTFGEIATEIASILVDTAEIGAAGAGLTEAGGTGDQFSAIPWNATWDAEVQSEVNDGLVAFGAATAANVSAVETDTQDIQSRLPAALVSGRIDASVGAVAAGAITDASFDTTAGDFHALGIVDQGQAQSATSTTLVLRSAAAFADDELIGAVILITGGSAGVGQARTITDYVSSTDTATVDAWTTTPTGTITYKIFASPPDAATPPDVNVATIGGQTASATGAVDFDDLAAILTDTAEIGAAGAGLSAVPWNAAWDAEVQSECTDALNAYDPPTRAELTSDISGLNDLSAAQVNAEVDSAIVTYGLDHLVSASVTGTDVADDSIIAQLVSKSGTADWDSFDNASHALEAIRDRGDAAWTTGAGGTPPQLLQNTTIATLASQTSFTLTAGSADDDAYNGAVVVVTDQSTATQKAVGSVQDYVGSTKTVTLAADPGVFTMAVGDTIDIIANASSAPTAAQVRAEMDANSTQLAAIVEDTGTTIPAQITALNDPTAAAIADAVWDEAQSGHVAAGSFGEIATEIASILVDTAEIGAAGAGLSALPWNAAWDAEVQSECTDALNAYDPPTRAELTSDIGALNDPTAAVIAAAVWDEAQSGHVAAGSFGEIATEAAAIKAKTDSLTFTIAGHVDANAEYINGAEVVGDGNATPWDGA